MNEHTKLDDFESHFQKKDDEEGQQNNLKENVGIFRIRTANKTLEEASKKSSPKMLFGKLWFENELCILFADTNQGKSILAVQIANSISKGEQIDGFVMNVGKQPVLYFDFELTDKQFELRYSSENAQNYNPDNHYLFDDNFLRVEINYETSIPDNSSFDELITKSIHRSVKKTGAKILIIDNITYLRGEIEKAKNASPLMKILKVLKSKYGLSILVLAHTPKRDLSKPITRNDLAGSKMLINFTDSAYAIGESHKGSSIKYIKQIKARNTEIIFDSENVIICQICKLSNFLEFNFIGHGSESENLRQLSSHERKKLEQDIIEMKKTNPGLSLRDIAFKLKTNQMKVKRTLDKASNLGQL